MKKDLDLLVPFHWRRVKERADRRHYQRRLGVASKDCSQLISMVSPLSISELELFNKEIDQLSSQVKEYLYQERFRGVLYPRDIRESVYYYTELGGKRLRPAILALCCGAVGGNVKKAIPAAAAVELYHTWTLIHDDIIDQDEKRRHGDSVHAKWAKVAHNEYGLRGDLARHYGVVIGILAGDVQKGWSVAGILPDLHFEEGMNPVLVLKLIRELDYVTLLILVDGETLDVQYSHLPTEKLSEKKIIDMLWKKTGALYKFCGKAGAMIGLDSVDDQKPEVESLSEFASRCGTAFQLQDDILGIVGDERQLGKPVGSDLRQGKRTIPFWKAYREAGERERQLMERVSTKHVTLKEIEKVVSIIEEHDGIEYTQRLATAWVEGGKVGSSEVTGALSFLDKLPQTKYKDLLEMWARFVITRTK
jgi:geranylgeranyl diphosphate synthase type I